MYFHTPFAQGKKLTSTQYFRLLQKMITANHESIITHCGNIISLFPHIPHIVEAINFYSEPCGNPMNKFPNKKCVISAQIFPQSRNIFRERRSPQSRVLPCLPMIGRLLTPDHCKQGLSLIIFIYLSLQDDWIQASVERCRTKREDHLELMVLLKN